MRKTFLASAMLSALAGSAHAQQQMITPGSGSLTDVAGNVWMIAADGSIQENGQYVAGGGGTEALTTESGLIYGEDASGRGWFIFVPGGNYWVSAPAPTGATTAAITAAATAAASPCATSSGSNGFGILPSTSGGIGQIYDQNGKPWSGRGIGIMEGSEPSLSALQSDFHGINFVRYAIYDYASPAALSNYVNSLTSAGIVVELENHNNGAGNAGGSAGVIFTGAALAQEQAWYASVAGAFQSNPDVWFGTNNEPSETDASGNQNPAALSAWQQTTVNTIRSAGNNTIVMVEANCWANGGQPVCVRGYVPSVYSQMSNIAWDAHFYGWIDGYSTDQATNNAFLAQMMHQMQAIPSAGGVTMPVIIGEYGNSTLGTSIDPNAVQVVDAVQQAGQSGSAAATAAWAWGTGNPGDGLSGPGGGLSSYGQQVAPYIAQMPTTASGVPSTPSACSTTAAATPSSVPTVVALGATDPSTPPADTTPAPSQVTAAAGSASETAPAPSQVTAAPALDPSVQDAQAQQTQAEAQATAVMQQIQSIQTQLEGQISALQALIQSGQAPSSDALTPNTTAIPDTTQQ